MPADHNPSFCGRFGEFYFPSAAHEEAAARVGYLAETRRCGFLSGDSGVGKSLLLKLLATELRRRRHAVVQADCCGVSTADELAARLRAAVGFAGGGLNEFARGQSLLDRPTVVLLDNAEDAGPGISAAMPYLRDMCVVWAGTRCDEDVLERHCDLAIPVARLRPEEVAGYLAAGVEASGVEASGVEGPDFTGDAAGLIADLTGGLPRSIDRLARLAVAAAEADAEPVVTATMVEAVCNEMPSRAGRAA